MLFFRIQFVPYLGCSNSKYSLIVSIIENELEEKIYISTRKLMRHQDNWFKKTDKRIKWINFENSFHEADIIISEWLKN